MSEIWMSEIQICLNSCLKSEQKCLDFRHYTKIDDQIAIQFGIWTIKLRLISTQFRIRTTFNFRKIKSRIRTGPVHRGRSDRFSLVQMTINLPEIETFVCSDFCVHISNFVCSVSEQKS